MFIYCKYKVLVALQYQFQYSVFTLHMLLAFTATTDLCSGSLKLLIMCKYESLSFFFIILLCFISQIVNAFEATEV
jgi:hypothetical protein